MAPDGIALPIVLFKTKTMLVVATYNFLVLDQLYGFDLSFSSKLTIILSPSGSPRSLGHGEVELDVSLELASFSTSTCFSMFASRLSLRPRSTVLSTQHERLVVA